jgi:HEAT repeat protein
MAFLRASGRAAVPALVALVPSLTDPQQRRAFSDLAMQMGMEQVEPLLHLLQSEQGFVAAEALHMLAQLGQLDRRAARESLRHTKPQVRLALLQHVDRMDADVAEEVILELLDDREPRVRGEAVHLIGRCDPGHAKAAVEAAIAREGFEETSLPVKQAFLSAYVAVSGRAALDRLEEIIQETDRRLVRKPVEELAVAAVAAVAALPSSKSVTILKKACLSRNKAVRKLARAELSKVRKDFE